MIGVSLLFLLSAARAMPEAALMCGNDYITDPKYESCCAGVPFQWRTQYCCNGVLSQVECQNALTPITFDGPALIFHGADPVDGDVAGDFDDIDDSDDEDEADDTANDDEDSDEPESTSVSSSDDSSSVDNTNSPNSESDSDTDDSDEESGESADSDDGSDDDSDDDNDDEDSDDSEGSDDSSEDAGTSVNGDGDDDGQFAGIFDGENGSDGSLNSDGSSSSDMDYYVKITLINMWLILGLILVVNIIFYWCYCRKNNQANRLDRVKSNNMFVEDPSISQRSDEEEAEMV